MRYVTASDVIQINTRLVGPGQLRDFGLLESAVLRPQTTVGGEDAYPDIITKGAVLFHSLCKNHAFVDGNKRTAVMTLVIFLGMNGVQMTASDIDLIDLALDTANGRVTGDDIAARLKTMTYEAWASDSWIDGTIEPEE